MNGTIISVSTTNCEWYAGLPYTVTYYSGVKRKYEGYNDLPETVKKFINTSNVYIDNERRVKFYR